MNLDFFLESLRDLKTDDELIDYCRKYVIHGTPHIFLNCEDKYYEFRKRVANKFNNQSEVGNYKVSAGVFKSYLHFEEYTISGFRDLRNSLNIGK